MRVDRERVAGGWPAGRRALAGTGLIRTGPAGPTLQPSAAAIAGTGLLAAVIGIAIALDPGLSVAIIGGAAAMLVAFLAPARVCLVLLLCTAVSVQYVFPDAILFGLDLLAWQKLSLLLLLAPALLQYGIVWFRVLPFIALAASFLLTWLWGEPLGALTPAESGKALVGLVAPFLIMLARWPEREARLLLRAVLFLPPVSLAAGLFLQAAGLHPVVMNEFTGAFRLQGASIPAHLAFLSFTAFAAAILLWKRERESGLFLYGMMAANFVILLLTGTRGPLLASVPLVLVFLADLARLFAKGRSALVVPLAGLAGLLSLSVIWQWDNLLKRSFTRATAFGIDMSGREVAWRYFLDKAAETPWLGRGLGAVLHANNGTLLPGFAVPHNEYIRFYFDAGLVGAILLFAALLAVLVHAAKGWSTGEKGYWSAFVAGFLVYSFSDNTLSTLQFMVPFCLIIGACGAARCRNREKRGRP